VNKIIANKRIDITADEYSLYEQISAGYPNGKDLFRGLFETDENGIITCLIPPKKKFSMEIVIFLQNIMVHQHLRLVYKEHNEAIKELNELKTEAKKLISSLKESSLDKKSK